MTIDLTALQRGQSRVFIIENRAGPSHVPEFLDVAAAGAFEQAFGDVTRIEVPSPNQYGQFEIAGEVQGAIENATLPIMYQSGMAISRLYDLSRRRCPYDIQIHFGDCEDPQDFDAGWKFILALERARTTTFSTEDLGSLTSGDNEKVTEEMETSALRAYYIGRMGFAKRAESEITASVISISVCDKPDCGECGASSNGCQVVLAVTDPAGSSPGLLPEVVYTEDGYTTPGDVIIDTFTAGENPDDATCVGSYFVVVSSDSGSMHIAVKDDILDDSPTWQEVSTGFVALKGPQAIVSVSPRDTWIVGKGGYIYFTSNPVDGVTVQDAGVATTENLNDVDAFSSTLVVAVGDNNAVVFTESGGDSWASVTGPAVGINLSTVAIRGKSEWWVGAANGRMYYTLDKGQHWTEKSFTGNGVGDVKRIKWASDTVGFMIHNTGTLGRLLRSVSGGNSWYVLPESNNLALPTQVQLNDIDVCQDEANVVYAGGLATGSADGVIIKGSPIT